VNVREIFPPRGHGRPPYLQYVEIVRQFGEILLETHEDGYQGDSFYVLRRVNTVVNDSSKNRIEYGFLTFGWGSCSGCDALEGVGTYEDLQDLVDSLQSSIIWFPSKDALKMWSRSENRKTEWSWASAPAIEMRSMLESW